MAVKAVTEVTITDETDILSLVTWYALTSSASAPTKPSTTQTSASVPSPWTTNEPSFDPAQGTKYLYTVIQTRWKDGTCTWDAPVQLSSAYEQAKQAWNKANAAKDAADAATEAAANAVVTKSMSGERTIVTADAAELPLLTLLPVLGESVQDGTPTPSAPVYIQAVRGRNLLISDRKQWALGNLGSGVYNNAVNQCTPTQTDLGKEFSIPVESSTTYVLKAVSSLADYPNIYVGVHTLTAAKSFIADSGWQNATQGYTFTTTSDTKYIRVTFRTDPYNQETSQILVDAIGEGVKIMLTRGSSVFDYVPYGHIGVICSNGNTTYLYLKGNELHGLDETYRDVLTIDASGHALVEKRTGSYGVNDLIGTWAHTSGDTSSKKCYGFQLPIEVNSHWQQGVKTKCNLLDHVPNGTAGYSSGVAANTFSGHQSSDTYPRYYYCNTSTSITTVAQFLDAMEDVEFIAPLQQSSWYTIDLGYVDLPVVSDDSTVYVAAEVQPVIGGTWWTQTGYSAGQAHVDALNAARKNSAQPFVVDEQTAATRWWRADCPDLTELKDGQQLTIWLSHGHANSKAQDVGITAAELVPTETISTSNANAWLNLKLGTGQQTGWIPLYYGGSTRITSHYGVNNAVHLTYKENAISGIPRGWWGDANYYSNDIDNRIVYFAGKTGAKGLWATSLFMEDGVGTYQNICTASDGTVTDANRTTATTKKANTNGFKVGGTVYFTNTTYAANTNISGWGVVYSGYANVIDARYSFNAALTANFFTPYKPIYLVGTVNPNDGLYYLDTTWWTQTPNNPNKVYVLVGSCYDSTTSVCRFVLYEENPWYIYDQATGKLVALNQTVTTFSNKYNTLVDTVDEHTQKVGEFTAQIYGYYALSSTTAGTAAKTATIDPAVNNWQLSNGVSVAVKFTYANTTSSPTLSINGTAAAPIKNASGEALASSEYQWTEGALKVFVYDGTNWLMQDESAMQRLSSAETIVQQTANNVLIKATSSATTAEQAGESLISSLINVAPEGVVIDAAKLDVSGVITVGDLATRLSVSDLDSFVRGDYYVSTEDVTAQSGKTYYSLETVYSYEKDDTISVGDDVTGYYTKSGNTYTPASGTAASGVDYYQRIESEEYVQAQVSAGGSVTGLYERQSNLVEKNEKLVTDQDSLSGKYDALDGMINNEGGLAERTGNLETDYGNLDDAINGEDGLAERTGDLEQKQQTLTKKADANGDAIDNLGGFVNSILTLSGEAVTLGRISDGAYVGCRARLTADSVEFVDSNGAIIGSYGENMQIGSSFGTHIEAAGHYLMFLPANVTSNGVNMNSQAERDALLDKAVAYIAISPNPPYESVFYMTRSVVVKDMSLGERKWKFYKRSNNNLSLKWMGAM